RPPPPAGRHRSRPAGRSPASRGRWPRARGARARTARAARGAAASAGWRRPPPARARRPGGRPGRASPPSAPTPAGPRSRRACGRGGGGGACAPPLPRWLPTRGSRRARARAAGGSRRHLRAQAADPERPGAAVAAADVTGVFLRRDRAFGEQIAAELTVEGRVVAPQPLERHGRVLLLVVAVVLEDRPELVVGAGDRPLVVPVDRLEPLHARAVPRGAVVRLSPERLPRLVQGCAGPGHSIPPTALVGSGSPLATGNLPAELRGHVLDLEVLVDAFASAFAPEPRLLDATERPGRVRDEPAVEPHHARFEPLDHPKSPVEVPPGPLGHQPL